MINEGLKKYLQNSKVINLAVLDSVVDREIEKATEDIETGGLDEDTARFVAGQLSGDQTKLKLNSQNLKDFDFSTDYNSPLDSRSSLVYYIDFSEITIPKEVEKIGKYCFQMSASHGFEIINFESIENLKEIGDYAFKSRERTVVNIKNKDGIIEKIGQNAFYMPTTGDSGLSKEEHYDKYLKDLVENSEIISYDSFGAYDYYLTIDPSYTYETLGDVFFFRSNCAADEEGNGPWNNYKKIGGPNNSITPSLRGNSNKILNIDGKVEIIGGISQYCSAISDRNGFYDYTINFGDNVRKIGQYSLGDFYGSFTINIGSGIEKIEKGAIILNSAGNDGTERIINVKAKSSDFPNYQEWFHCLNGANYSNIQVNFLED